MADTGAPKVGYQGVIAFESRKAKELCKIFLYNYIIWTKI